MYRRLQELIITLVALDMFSELMPLRPAGFEPATDGLENRCSIRLSYGRDVVILACCTRNQMRSARFELATCGLGNRCSIHLSYERAGRHWRTSRQRHPNRVLAAASPRRYPYWQDTTAAGRPKDTCRERCLILDPVGVFCQRPQRDVPERG